MAIHEVRKSNKNLLAQRSHAKRKETSIFYAHTKFPSPSISLILVPIGFDIVVSAIYLPGQYRRFEGEDRDYNWVWVYLE